MTNLITPGVYIREIPSGVRSIAGVSTSTTAFVGAAPKGEANNPVQISNFGEYTSLFGGLNPKSPMSFAVQQYFQNGGQTALIVRVFGANARPARFTARGHRSQRRPAAGGIEPRPLGQQPGCDDRRRFVRPRQPDQHHG